MKPGWISVALLTCACGVSAAQTCTTQAKLVGNVRDALADTALAVAGAIKDGDTGGLAKMASPDLAANFNATAYLARTTGEKLAGDSLHVTQLDELDANARAAGDTSEADFSCALTGSPSEIDFGISGLPPGLYAFAMVEAAGEHPWVISMLLREQGGWKLAGLYPHARTAAGHDGLWYWTDARAKAKAGSAWAAWLEYGEADDLLRPANFVSTTHLDKLRDERSSTAPPELRDGLSATTPYAIKATDGTTFSITSLATDAPPEATRLHLLLHFNAAPLPDTAAERARNVLAAKTFLAAHPDVRGLIDGAAVFADSAGQPPFATEVSSADLK